MTVLATALLLALFPDRAAAQSAAPEPRQLSDAEREEARALFVAGSAAVDAGRWADAIDRFERAYALTDAPSALYNLAMALRALGRHREARDDFTRLLEHHELDPELRAQITQLRREASARVAVIELGGLEPELEHVVRFDGRVIPSVTRPVEIETDAGAHTLLAEREGARPFVWEGSLQDGERLSLSARFQALERGDDTVLHVVLVVVGVVALAGAGAALGVYLHDQAQVQPLFDLRIEP